ncbi:nephrocystin-3-like [Mytilus edulis]|uniref:nephrocystin-3-like n=1 Tax=Mytilus edulis TaxID=6550 RepID=UPI0039EF5FC0
MGTGGSFLHNPEDDDILGKDLDGSSRGVIKRIPIEIRPRGRLGLKSGSSRKGPKGGSLSSALSVEIENTEVERIRKEFEMYRINKDNEMANSSRKEQQLIRENKKLKAELVVLQKTCTNLRGERDMSLEAEQHALIRAATFEDERGKLQRNFKIFRETMERELQNILREKRRLENKLAKIALGYSIEDVDAQSRQEYDENSNNNPGEWWPNMDGEPSLSSTMQLQQPSPRLPEFVHSMVEPEGMFTNVNKEDWSTVLSNLSQNLPSAPEHSLSPVLRIYISAPRDTHTEVEILIKDYYPRLQAMCETEGRSLVMTHLPYDDTSTVSQQFLWHQQISRKQQISKSCIFLAFLGDSTDKFTSVEYKIGYLDNPTAKSAIFCFRDVKGIKSGHSDAKDLKSKIREKRTAKIIDGYTSPSRGVEQASSEIEKILSAEIGLESRAEGEEDENEDDGPDQLCGGHVWDVQSDNEQLEAINLAKSSSCELGFERHYERLNGHVLSAGPLPPLLILGPSGCGRSLLLAKWIQLQQEKIPSSLLLYHFVGRESTVSADPIMMMRRLTAQLMQQLNSPPQLTSDPVRIVEEFPRWLERISSRTPGGAIVVLDSIDRFQQAEVHLKWLKDPLPVDTRIIVSACEETCPQSWRSWPTVRVEPLSNKNVKELLHAELATLDASISSEEETSILTQCRTPSTCCSLYVMVLARHISGYTRFDSKPAKHLENLLTCTDCVSLYCKVLDVIRYSLETHENRGHLKMILRFIYVSRCGLRESELLDLMPNLSSNFLTLFTEILFHHLIIKYQGGLLMFAHQQMEKAALEYCFGKEEAKLIPQYRQNLIQYFSNSLSPGKTSCRVSDELPWLLRQSQEKEELQQCLLNLCVFQRLYSRGRCPEILSYWQFVAADKNTMAQLYFNATRKMEELVGQYGGLITLERIADLYDSLGHFLKDLGQLNQAVSALQKALEIRETTLHPDHPIVARTHHILAGLYAQWGKFSTAEDFYKQALALYENEYGMDHPLVATELEALAQLYQRQDRHDQADPLKKRSVNIRKKQKSPKVTPMQTQAKTVVQRRALQLEELALGPDSPDNARILNELGVLYYLQNDFETAESFFKRALEMRESTLGPDHLDLAQSLNNLAALYNDRKQFNKAEPLYERALDIKTKYLSTNHESVASIINHLALLYRKQGKFDQALPLYKQAVEIREKTFGTYHPSVATALVNLAVLYSQQNKYADAEPMYERALKIYDESLGPQHPRVAETLRNLAVMKYELKDFEAAAKLYKKATEIKENETTYGGKALSIQSSSGESTLKNMMNS